VERAAVVGEEIVVVAVEGFDRFEDRERRIHRTVAAVPGQKSKEHKRATVNIENLVNRKKRNAEGDQ